MPVNVTIPLDDVLEARFLQQDEWLHPVWRCPEVKVDHDGARSEKLLGRHMHRICFYDNRNNTKEIIRISGNITSWTNSLQCKFSYV